MRSACAYLLHRSLENHPIGFFGVLRKLVEVQITISINGSFIYLRNVGLVLFRRRQFANQRDDFYELLDSTVWSDLHEDGFAAVHASNQPRTCRFDSLPWQANQSIYLAVREPILRLEELARPWRAIPDEPYTDNPLEATRFCNWAVKRLQNLLHELAFAAQPFLMDQKTPE